MWAIYRQVMGTWQEDTVPLGSREPTPLGVQGRPVTISQNKPKAIIKHCAPDAFLLPFFVAFLMGEDWIEENYTLWDT